ncbi:DUF4232 domain-containing protein [Streptomyces lydicus]|uniref:DUF4232 domain-containing protein n=1 Tax=Streptomyces lydicus TaxID=47763 RepID=UPI0033F88908
MSTFRQRTTLLAAASTAVLALALTACGGNGSGTEATGSAANAPAPAAASGRTAEQADTAKGAGAAQNTGGSHRTGAKSPGTAKTSGSASAPDCTTKDVSLRAAYHDGPPYTHIVLTAKNTSGHSCRLKGYPEIQFLESHRENVPAVAKSKPAAPVVLTPGTPAYALVRLSNGGVDENTEPVTAFSVMLQGSDGLATVNAPGAGLAVDPAKWATGYWTDELRNGADDF